MNKGDLKIKAKKFADTINEQAVGLASAIDDHKWPEPWEESGRAERIRKAVKVLLAEIGRMASVFSGMVHRSMLVEEPASTPVLKEVPKPKGE